MVGIQCSNEWHYQLDGEGVEGVAGPKLPQYIKQGFSARVENNLEKTCDS